MKIEPVILEGEHVRLEPLCDAHADPLVASCVGHDLFRWFPFVLDDEAAMRGYVKVAVAGLAAGIHLPFATIDRASGRVVGSTSYLAIDVAHRRLEIGATWIAPSHQRSAVNTEAKLLQLTHCFEELRCHRVEFKTDSLNERSRGALAGIGATFEGIFRNHMIMPGGRLRHSAWYSVIDEEWPAVKAHLRARLDARLDGAQPGAEG